jgi:hypothetical protein
VRNQAVIRCRRAAEMTVRPSAMGNVFQRQIARALAEPADGQHHDQHAADDERQHARRAEVIENTINRLLNTVDKRLNE